MAVQLPKSTRATSKEVDRRLDAVVAKQEKIFVDRQPRSWQLSERARSRALAGGVTSSWQITRPRTLDQPRRRLEDLRRRRHRIR